MKCPFCDTELTKYALNEDFSLCFKIDCRTRNAALRNEIWQALIDGKKAQEALKAISGILLLDEPKPSVLMPAGKREIKRRIAEITEPKEE